MSYTAISDFQYGLDRRRPQSSGVPGTLWILQNAVLSRGGDIERAKKFAERHVLPAGETHGYFAVRRQKYVFGEGTEPVGMPTGVRYQQLAAPGAPTMTDVLDAKGFGGQVYAIAAYDDGNIYHFFDGERVTDWDLISAESSSFESVAERLASLIDAQDEYQATAFGGTVEITAATPGVGYTISVSTTDNGVTSNPTIVDTEIQANVAEVLEVRAAGTVTITGGTADPGVNFISSVTVDGVELLGESVDWVGSNDATANALSVEINNHSFTHGYTASAAGDVVTIQAAVGTGSAPNGFVVVSTVAGDVTTSDANMAGGVDYVAPVAQVYTVEVDADDTATGNVQITGGTSSPNTNTVESITIDGEELLTGPVDWATSNDATATAVAADINTGTGTHGFTAAAVGDLVAITSPNGEGTTLAGLPIVVETGGDVTVEATNMRVGFGADLWTITLDGNDYKTTALASATGTFAYVNNSRVYSGAGSLIRYCRINDPTDWQDTAPASGAGFINIANRVDGATTIYGAARYNDLTAIFARDTVVTYSLPADAQASELVQVLENTGTISPRALVSYGANDVYYLDTSGVRSLRTRDVVAQAYASDVGSALDPFIQEIFDEVGEAVRSEACAAIEPIDGRYMLAIGHYVVVLSYFPSSKIVAWSFIDFGEQITDMVRVDRTVHIRAGDTIYAYGGASGDEYPDADEFPILAETPFISSKDPAGIKTLEGFDMAAVNTWRVQALPDPNKPESFIDIGFIHGTTYALPAVKLPGYTSHYALRFTCDAAGFASLSSTAVHHSKAEAQ